jgi:hypothetical protein
VALLFYFVLFCFVLVYFYNTHQMLRRQPQGFGGLAMLFFLFLFIFITPGARMASPIGWWPCYFMLF